MSTIVAQICIRRDTAANFTSANPTLALGEIAYETDTRNIKVGTGSTAWTALPYINPFRGGTAAAPTSNTVLGSGAGAAMQAGAEDNVLIGLNAGNNITTADGNVLIGKDVGNQTTGSNSVAIGWEAMASSGSAAFNSVAVGYRSLWQATGGNNVAVGLNAETASGSFSGVTAVGASAASLNTANDITAVGANALDANTTGTGNTAVGKDALGANTTGGNNVAIGNSALAANTTGEANVAIGSLQTLSSCTSGTRNVAISPYALAQLTTGQRNVAIGEAAGYELLTSSSDNTLLGHEAGRRIAAGTGNSASSNSIFIGTDTRAAANSQSNQIVIGYQAVGNGSNTTTIGNSSTTGTFIPAGDLILSGSTQQVLVGTSTAPSDDIKLQVRRDGDAKIAVVSPISGGLANATLNLDASTQGSWAIQAGSAASAGLRFYDFNAGGGGSERIRFDASGNIDLKAGNVIVTSGKGIDFSATSHAGGMTSELLSDYEEGTWTPVFSPATGSFTTLTMDVVAATYTKVGRQVTVVAYIRTDNVDATGASGTLRVDGLPFTSGSSNYASANIGLALSWGGDYPRAGYISPSDTKIVLTYRASVNGEDFNMQVSDMTTGATQNQNITYVTATYFT